MRCNSLKILGWVVIFDPNRILAKRGFTNFYLLCLKCQNEIRDMYSLDSLQTAPKKIEDYEVRKKVQEYNRTLCSKCSIKRDETHWTMIFLSPRHYVKRPFYLHAKCMEEIQIEMKIIKPRSQSTIEATLFSKEEKKNV